MAIWTKREWLPPIRHEYVLPTPVNWAEFDKAMIAATEDFKAHHNQPLSDDSVWVTYRDADEEIIIYWKEGK